MLWEKLQNKKEDLKLAILYVHFLGGGGYAQYVCAPEGMVMPMPENLSF